MTIETPKSSLNLPIEMLVMRIAADFPDLADECTKILEEPNIDRDVLEREVTRTIKFHQLRLQGGFIDSPM